MRVQLKKWISRKSSAAALFFVSFLLGKQKK
jgi:hypothetical protein